MMIRVTTMVFSVLLASNLCFADSTNSVAVPCEVIEDARTGFKTFIKDVHKHPEGFQYTWDIGNQSADLSKIRLDDCYLAYALNEEQMLSYLWGNARDQLLSYATLRSYVFPILLDDIQVATLTVTRNERWDGSKLEEEGGEYAFGGYSNGSKPAIRQALHLRELGHTIALVSTRRWLGKFFIAESRTGRRSVITAEDRSCEVIRMVEASRRFKNELRQQFSLIEPLHGLPDSTMVLSDLTEEIHRRNPYPCYEFRGVEVNGDPPVDHLEKIMLLLEETMQPGEKLLKVSAAEWKYGIVYATTQYSFSGCHAGNAIEVKWDGASWLASIEGQWID